MEIIQETNNNASIIKPVGRLDSNTAPELDSKITDFAANNPTHLILNFDDLEYISSAGLRIVLKAAKLLKAANLEFITCGMQDHVQEVFEISGFDSFITICPSLDDALASLK